MCKLHFLKLLTLCTLGLLIFSSPSPAQAVGSWSTGTAGGTARHAHSSVVYNGKIYSWGGDDGGITNALDIYDIATDTWSNGTAGGTARNSHSSVLYNGKMYSWGGNGDGGLLNTLDIYDIANDSWSTGTAGGTARYSHSSVLYNGKIYSWGGRGDSVYFNTLDIYDIAIGTWSTGTAGGTARYAHSSIVSNGKMYSWGGYSGMFGGGRLNDLDIYDIANGTWSYGTTGGTARYDHSSVVYNGKIYSWGGVGGAGKGGDLNTLDIYSPGLSQIPSLDLPTNEATNQSLSPALITKVIDTEPSFIRYKIELTTNSSFGSWSTGTSGGTARTDHSSVLSNGKIYSWGGNGDGGFLNTLDIYDIATDTWSTGTAGGTARTSHSSVVYNGKIYSWGGNSDSDYLNTLDIYDIATDTWSTGAAGGTTRSGHSSVVENGKIYSWGGVVYYSGFNYLNTLDIYDIATDTWSTGTAGGTARSGHSSVVENGKIYSWGGNEEIFVIGGSNTLDIYDIATDSWSTGTAGGTARSGHSSVLSNGKIYSWGGSDDSGYLNTLDIYDLAFSLTTFDQTTSQTGWSGQDTESGTAYQSGTQAVYTLQTALLPNTTYYWRSYYIDPAEGNAWSDTQTTPFSFTTGDGSTPTPSPMLTPTPTTTSTSSTPGTAPTLPPEIANRLSNGQDANGECVAQKPGGMPEIFRIDMTDTKATLYIAPPSKPYGTFTISYKEIGIIALRNDSSLGSKLYALVSLFDHPVYADSPEYAIDFSHTDDGGVVEYTINDLKPNTRYEFKVKCANKCASTSYGNTVAAATQVLGVSTKKIYTSSDGTLSPTSSTSLASSLASAGSPAGITIIVGFLLLVSGVGVYAVKPRHQLTPIYTKQKPKRLRYRA